MRFLYTVKNPLKLGGLFEMKKELFLEPEVEILNFLCNEIHGPDTGDFENGTGDDDMPGGDLIL